MGLIFLKQIFLILKPVNDITYNAGVLYSSNLDGTSISYSYDGIFWFTSNYNGIGVIESIAGNGSNRVVVGTSTGVFYNSSLKTDSTLIANITKGLFYDSLGNINIDSNYIKYLIRNNTSGGGSGGTTDTTSLSNRINAKLDVQRFSGDSTNKQNSINFLRLNKIDSVTINGDTTLLTFYRNGTSSYNIQLKRASGGVVGISTKWNNLSISGYQVQKINDSTYNINRDNTIIQDSIRINGKLDVARFTGDSIRWDTAISNRIINGSVDTISNVITLNKTNGGNISLQLRKAGGANNFDTTTIYKNIAKKLDTNFFVIDTTLFEGKPDFIFGKNNLRISRYEPSVIFGNNNSISGVTKNFIYGDNNSTGGLSISNGSQHILLGDSITDFRQQSGSNILINLNGSVGSKPLINLNSNVIKIQANGLNDTIRIPNDYPNMLHLSWVGLDTIINSNNYIKWWGNNRYIYMPATNKNGILGGGGSTINNDSVLHPYPYPYKDTIKLVSTTDKILQIGTNNQVAINLSESIKVSQLFNVQTNINQNVRNGKFVRWNNTFQTFAGNQLLSSGDGTNYTQYTTSQIMSGNNQYNTIEAIDLTGDSLVVLTSAGGGNYILCILGSLGSTILYRSASFTISDGSGSFVTDVSKIQLLGTSLYAVNGASFNNYLIKINIVNLSNQTIATLGSPAAFFKSTTNLYYLDYSGWVYEVNAPTTRIMRVSNAVTDATFLENKYICASDYSGNVYIADLTSLQVVDFIPESYFGSDDISVFAYGSILYVLEGNTTNLYTIGYQLNFASVVANAIAPFRFYNSLQDSAGNNGTNGQVLTSQNGKAVWGTPTQQFPLQSILIWGSTASGAAQNPQLSFQSNNIGLALSGTGVTLPAGTYQITLVAGMPAIDNSAPYPISFFKFGLSSTIDATFSTYNEIRGCINKASSPAGNTDVLNSTFSITITVTTSTIYYVTTYINRGTSAAMSGFVNIVRIK